ncbi:MULTISPECIES: DUF2815 family protein [unclassified Fusobacterium]|nr:MULTISPECIES: DUF2815 family protein [unclassified Fusobacterium]
MTGKVRLSYVHLFEPYAPTEGQEAKFSTTILIPKSDTVTMGKIQSAIEEATKQGEQKQWGGKRPPKVANPLHDGDGTRPSDGMEYGEECKGHWVITASSKADRKPGIVDNLCNPIIDQTEVYSGMYARVTINFFPYAVGGKKGIGCGLGNIQKLADGEPLSSAGIKAENEFSSVEIDPITGEIIKA